MYLYNLFTIIKLFKVFKVDLYVHNIFVSLILIMSKVIQRIQIFTSYKLFHFHLILFMYNRAILLHRYIPYTRTYDKTSIINKNKTMQKYLEQVIYSYLYAIINFYFDRDKEYSLYNVYLSIFLSMKTFLKRRLCPICTLGLTIKIKNCFIYLLFLNHRKCFLRCKEKLLKTIVFKIKNTSKIIFS